MIQQILSISSHRIWPIEQITTGLWCRGTAHMTICGCLCGRSLNVGWCVVALGPPAHSPATAIAREGERTICIFSLATRSGCSSVLSSLVQMLKNLLNTVWHFIAFLLSMWSNLVHHCLLWMCSHPKSCSRQCPKPSLTSFHLLGGAKR